MINLTEKSLNTATNNNLDPSEIAKFDAMAQHWWDPHGPCGPLHRLNPLRVEWIKQHLPGLNYKTVLDVGCGGGLLTEALSPDCLQITGIDGSEQAIQIAKKHASGHDLNIDYYVSTAEAFALQRSHEFDAVCCLELIEHVPQPDQLVVSLAKLTKPGGWVFLSTLNRTPKAYATAILGAEYLLKWLPKGTHDYQQFIRPSELVQAARNAHLKLEALQGIQYHPLKQCFSFSEDLSVNYLARFRFEP